MKVTLCVATGPAVLLVAWPVFAQQPIFYPAKGQSQQRQQTDLGERQVWAKQNRGVDPAALTQQVPQQMATFNRAVAACMSGRGYTVQ